MAAPTLTSSLSSPHSSVGSTRSFDSFHTAKDSNDDASKSTAASSPAQTDPCPHHGARPVPRELKAHCQIFLEEQLYTSAINLLNSILASGTSRRAVGGKPAASVRIPPPSHLALLNTLVIHPQYTTRVEHQDHLDVSSMALDYLRNVLSTVGPLNADLRSAFQFLSSPRLGRRSAFSQRDNCNHENDSDMTDPESDGGNEDRLRGRMSNESSLWARGQDFWSTVGWAFNCSALHPNRWRYWKVWFEYMLDVLDADWTERERRDFEAHEANGKAGEPPTTSREDSLILAYMNQTSGRQTGLKGIMRSLFADGSSMSSTSFPEVFDKELRGPKKNSKKRKREQVLDVENDQFGDYFDDDSFSSGGSEPPTPEKSADPTARNTGKSAQTFGSSSAGLAESAVLRLRLFRLLSSATYTLRKRSELMRLYEDFASGIKLLPLSMFALFVSQRTNPLLQETHITIIKELFHLLLPSSYKDPRKVDPEGDATGSLTTAMLEHCYAIHPANTVGLEDNAKLSLVVESAIQLLWSCSTLEYTESVTEAVERGISARATKAKKKKTGKAKSDPDDSLAQSVLDNSALRIRILLDVIKETSVADAE